MSQSTLWIIRTKNRVNTITQGNRISNREKEPGKDTPATEANKQPQDICERSAISDIDHKKDFSQIAKVRRKIRVQVQVEFQRHYSILTS